MKKLIFVLAYLLLAVPCVARIITVDDDGTASDPNVHKGRRTLNKTGNYNIILH